jgi:flagellar protein FliL
MAAEEVEELEETPKKSKLPLILGALAVFVLGGGAGFGGSVLAAGSGAGEELEENAEVGEEVPVEDPRAVHDLGLFTVNLRGSGGGRVLRMEVSLETTEASLETVVAQEAQLRDTVITLVSDYAYTDLEGLDGKTRLRDELLGRVNTLMPPEARVERIYFTQFVVQ